jgi:hypothetical protein
VFPAAVRYVRGRGECEAPFSGCVVDLGCGGVSRSAGPRRTATAAAPNTSRLPRYPKLNPVRSTAAAEAILGSRIRVSRSPSGPYPTVTPRGNRHPHRGEPERDPGHQQPRGRPRPPGARPPGPDGPFAGPQLQA